MTKTARTRRPFRTAARRPTRRELLELLRGIYGPGIPRYPGAPYAGERYNDAEIVIHELAHATQLEREAPIQLGAMRPSWLSMKQCLDSLPKEEADQHEINAVAITFGVSKRLRLPLSRDVLTECGALNSHLLFDERKKFDQLVAEREPHVLLNVQTVLDIIDRAWARWQESSPPSVTRPTSPG